MPSLEKSGNTNIHKQLLILFSLLAEVSKSEKVRNRP